MATEPRVVRNWWIVGKTSDGREVAFGPRPADGTIHIEIFQRVSGKVAEVLTIIGTPVADTLRLDVEAHAGQDKGKGLLIQLPR